MMSKHVAIALVLAFAVGLVAEVNFDRYWQENPSQLINSEKIQELIIHQIS
jgi:hypothetical protein